MKPCVLILLLAASLTAVAPDRLLALEADKDPQAPAEQAAIAIEAAEAARKRAAEAGTEWLQTGSLIEEAREAANSERWEQALNAAQQARRQAELAVEQAAQESTAWRERVVR